MPAATVVRVTKAADEHRPLHREPDPRTFLIMKRHHTPIILLVLLPGLAGCTSVKSPNIDIADVTIGEQTESALVLNFAVNLENENRQAVTLEEFNYDLSINGAHVYTGRRSAEATMAALGSNRITIPAVVPFDKQDVLADDAFDYTVRGSLTYLTEDVFSEMLYDSGLDTSSVSFQRDGTIHWRNSARSND